MVPKEELKNVETRRLSDSKNLRLPLDRYLITEEDARVISKGRIKLVGDCIKRFGVVFNYHENYESRIGTNERRYGLADPFLANAQGYHLNFSEAKQSQPSGTTLEILTGKIETYKGMRVPKDGCTGEAKRKLHEEELQSSIEVAQNLNHESYNASRQDRAVIKANKAWVECMRGKGYSYADPMSAISDDRFTKQEIAANERQTARADVLCKTKVNLIGIWASVETSYQQALIRDNQSALSKALEAKNKTFKAAESA
ncbi:hypothetical protein [Streptomyces nigra]|uniref:hypothetical protein n=1 Tax=Streptomyces nigra TaxID=1827580 RepID=UPI0038044DEA